MKKSIVIIAEAGVNHNGDMRLAKKLIDVAADAGADLVKFQTFVADRLVTPKAEKAKYQAKYSGTAENQYKMLSKLELSAEMHQELIAYCGEKNIGFFSSAFDIGNIDFLLYSGMQQIKVPSGEITNLPYLRHIGQLCKPIIMSTGMATLGDIEAAIDVLEKAGTPRDLLTLLHCTTEYPTSMEEVNLCAMQSIQSAFGVEVGYSDHTEGIEVAIAAAAMGACIIEKHFTLDKKLPGPDHKASAEPDELKAMVAAIRNIELALGDGIKRVTPSEVHNKKVARKSLVACRPIKAGEILSHENISVKRPGTGLSPMQWDNVLGRRAVRDFAVDDLIEL